MADSAEEFFISKIEEGLFYSADSLSKEEQRLLRTPVINIPTHAFSPQKGQRLNAKCVGALAEAYARDTAGENRNAAVHWRENNDQLYRSSQAVVSGIVQNWYLSVGRAQEKRATGCLPVLLVVTLVSTVLWVSVP